MKKTNPNFESQVQALRVSVPKFDGGVVHVPGSLSLIFDLAVSVLAKNYIVKTARGLVNKLTEKFAGEIAQNTDGYDLLMLHEDLLLTAENDRASKFREGIQSVEKRNFLTKCLHGKLFLLKQRSTAFFSDFFR